MPEPRVFDLIVDHIREVIPELEDHRFEPSDSLRDLGANSIDRAEVYDLCGVDIESLPSLSQEADGSFVLDQSTVPAGRWSRRRSRWSSGSPSPWISRGCWSRCSGRESATA